MILELNLMNAILVKDERDDLMVIKLTQEKLDLLSQTENEIYLNGLYKLIVTHSPALREDPELLQRLKDADDFVKTYRFNDKKVMTDFLITSAYEPYFYKHYAVSQWLLKGSESVECEYIKYQQIKEHLMGRVAGGAL